MPVLSSVHAIPQSNPDHGSRGAIPHSARPLRSCESARRLLRWCLVRRALAERQRTTKLPGRPCPHQALQGLHGPLAGGGPVPRRSCQLCTTAIGRKATAVTERVTRSTVYFAHPFALTAVEGEQPPGMYAIETTEVPIEGLSFVAYRRVSTTIMLASSQFGPGCRQLVTIDPLDLEAAQKRDAMKPAPLASSAGGVLHA